MKNFFKTQSFTLIMIISLQQVSVASDEVEKIKQAITEKDVHWTAEENWTTKLTSEEQKMLGGAFSEQPDPARAELLPLTKIIDFPTILDWRDNDGNWLTPVKNQGDCSSCWDFSAVAQVEAWWKITNNNPDSMIDLSEQFVLSGTVGTCDGGLVSTALDFIQSTGVPTETSLQYHADDEIPLSDAYENWEEEAVKIPGWINVTTNEAIIENIKNAVYHHPVSTTFSVYEDFFYYRNGVYEHVLGDSIFFGHAILIVGWNDDEQSWICKNSWGTDWGDEGYFRIKWGECSIGINAALILNEGIAGPALAVSPDELHFSLTCGDSLNEYITIGNTGFSFLEFTVMDHIVATEFHSNSFMAWDDNSWWCGNPQIGGYGDDWLQYLETPILDLSHTDEPYLSWMGLWEVEKPNEFFNNIGYDGCNVWISVDGGRTFNIYYPSSPAYTCNYLRGFGAGRTLAVRLPGWVGSSGGWIPVIFDLSSYKSDRVVIRFAFASNKDNCTTNDSLLYGFFVDEIKVSDGDDILFEDHGSDKSTMQQIGYVRQKAEWLNMSGETTVLQPNESINMSATIRTENLEPGSYHSMLRITTNDIYNPMFEVPCTLELRAPDDDDEITDILLNNDTPKEFNLAQNYPNPFNPDTKIKFFLPISENVKIEIYNAIGQKIETLIDKRMNAGHHEVEFHAQNLSSGLYLYKIEAGKFYDVKRMVLLK